MAEPGDRTVEERLHGWRAAATALGAVGLAGSIVLLFVDARSFFHGYLFGFTFWIGASLGCLAILMLHHLVAGEWGFVSQRILEAGASTIALMTVFFVPIFFGMHELYEWTHAETVAQSPVLQHKRPYLNVPFFAARAAIFFAAWCAMAWLLARWSRRADEEKHARYISRLRALSAGGLVAHVVLMTFASVDWVMSVEPHWFSSVYPWMIEVSQALVGIAVVVVLLTALRDTPALAAVLRTKHFHDYGNLLLAFVVLWAYLMFSQYLIMWAGDIPEDVRWYVHRTDGAWIYIVPAMIGLHFGIPFLLLLLRRVKRARRGLARVALMILAVHAVFVAWLVLPGFTQSAAFIKYVSGAAAWVGIGGCWATVMLTRLASRPLLPSFDPRFDEILKKAVGST